MKPKPDIKIVFTEQQQAAYRQAWGNMPYASGIIDYELSADALITTLNSLSEYLRHVSKRAQEEQDELAKLRGDVAGLGRVLRLANALSDGGRAS